MVAWGLEIFLYFEVGVWISPRFCSMRALYPFFSQNFKMESSVAMDLDLKKLQQIDPLQPQPTIDFDDQEGQSPMDPPDEYSPRLTSVSATTKCIPIFGD